ncbi:MAG: hypothetical protein A2233_03075 [Candidatus Kerfeldbacteria bacterium RIFOXYA2_FULL_38_24]|uniref:Right handed beta helix domain-containing protein n=1 Tax=Candidatus Kerfeldbacteria bacterium RIFOXYB2_FULL_38_14 TaxID=1798547 RepID=A0A1G2BC72_9BACT|nr:MAG: hypothetical protein A2233_03075 [Candidatus Kerfeldbacteria bacterium RIFOXYA2_FULL_38_24]OGY86179.1 MAG: hypothetical protein A2319_03280 [Candidatus Kerfeldbacteria bacterium RIFOXYB2_FULL_38_14]OGY89459.1 MAG: hypothetical protein A2458_02710 [Candidatus Kerfeldbacteria bacterium RIFOXYC2_FULL_38_9]
MICNKKSLLISIFILVSAFLFFSVLSTPAFAKDFTVNSTADVVDSNPGNGTCASASNTCTLRAAIMETNALAGDDKVILSAVIYNLTIPGIDEDQGKTGDLDIYNSKGKLTIQGQGADKTIIDAKQIDRVFDIENSNVIIKDLTITGGNALESNEDVDGGGVNITSNGDQQPDILIENSIIFYNQAYHGGGINAFGSDQLTINIKNSDISYNTANYGGGINMSSYTNNITCNIENSNIYNNTSNGNSSSSGGGIEIASNDEYAVTVVNIKTSNIFNNVSNDDYVNSRGGGIDVYSIGKVFLTIQDSAISNNVAGHGGGLYTRSNSFSSDGSLELSAVILTIQNSTISNNTASYGGGIYGETYYNGATLTAIIQNSTIANNKANAWGGGIYINASSDTVPLVLQNSTVANNIAGSYGAGIYISDYQDQAITSKASIIFNNTLNENKQVSNCYGAQYLVSQGYNIFGNDADCQAVAITTDKVLDNSAVVFSTGVLNDNGGSTQTLALASNSPAIDIIPTSQCSVATDQRGTARPQGVACDSGAYELEAKYLDYDQDGYIGETDCNDNNSSINPGFLDNTNDGIDNNCNDQIDEDYKVPADTNTNSNTNSSDNTNTTVDNSNNNDNSTTTAPAPAPAPVDEENTSPDSNSTITEVTIVKVSPTKKGYKITYSDNSTKVVKAFKKGKSSKKTKIKYLAKKDIVLVLQGNGKKIALYNVLTSKKLSQTKLSKKNYTTNSFKVKKVNGKKMVIVKSVNKKQQESQKSKISFKLKKKKLKLLSVLVK